MSVLLLSLTFVTLVLLLSADDGFCREAIASSPGRPSGGAAELDEGWEKRGARVAQTRSQSEKFENWIFRLFPLRRRRSFVFFSLHSSLSEVFFLFLLFYEISIWFRVDLSRINGLVLWRTLIGDSPWCGSLLHSATLCRGSIRRRFFCFRITFFLNIPLFQCISTLYFCANLCLFYC